mmetsp:Transcript_36402/g.74039  ORF Transcript_36402/g.74039 Transcript_36402/m.74039 type:complete len:137 (+) Transcript_36402:2214-2624(+)
MGAFQATLGYSLTPFPQVSCLSPHSSLVKSSPTSYLQRLFAFTYMPFFVATSSSYIDSLPYMYFLYCRSLLDDRKLRSGLFRRGFMDRQREGLRRQGYGEASLGPTSSLLQASKFPELREAAQHIWLQEGRGCAGF